MRYYPYGVSYTLKKGNEELTFNRVKDAANYLNSEPSYITKCWKGSKPLKGYTIIRNGSNYHYEAHKTRLYKIWTGMHERCYGKYHVDYHNYGGRGIKVCPEWRDYATFKEWAMQNGYSDKLSIDRIDVNGDYSPSNCRWATWTEQARNRRSNRFYEYKGKRYLIKELADEIGMNKNTLEARLRRGWSIEDAVEVDLIKHSDPNLYRFGKKR